ncbi:hypothetical protein ACQ4PT_035635 [Festuca glaucescens]
MAPKEAPKEALFQMRFGAKRLAKVVQKSMSRAKKAIIAKTPFKHLLNVASFAAPPMELIEYVVKHTNPKLREFRHKTRSILFTRDMVVKVLGVPSGNRPMVYLKRTQQSELRDLFKNDKGCVTIAKAIEVLENCADTDEAQVVQSFGLIAFATVLCPGTANLVKCEYLGSLMDANEIDQYAIDEHILKETMGEVALFKEKLVTCSKLDPSQIVWIPMCLPMLATIYMDFLSFPPLGPKEHNINPSTPRFCYVCDEDFRLVVEIDKNKLNLDPTVFGDRPLLPLSETLYAVVAPANAHRPHVDPAVGGDDGMGSEEVEVNPSASLNEWLEKGLASSHELQFLKAANAKRMAALLVDGHAANVASSSFTIPCPTAPDVHAKDPSPIMVEEDVVMENVVIDQALDICKASHMARCEPSRVTSPDPSRVASPMPFTEPTEPSRVASPEHSHVPCAKHTPVPSPEHSRVPSAVHTPVPSPEHSRVPSRVPSPEHSLVASPASSEDFEPTIASPSKWPPGFWDDAPSLELFEPRSDDAKFFATIPDIPRKDQSVAAATSGGSSVVVTPVRREDAARSIGPAASTVQEVQENVSSGPNTHDKKQRQKRAAKEIDTPPRMKKMKLIDTHQATYRKYIARIRKIGNFYVPYKNFLAVFKPRQYMDNQVMSLFVEKFNIENHMQATRNKRLRKKFAFSVRMTSELIKDPAKFQTKDVIVEFKNACDKYKISKMDLIWLPIVHEKHWATCCINLLHSQINSFDSIKPTKKGGSMEAVINNLITNFGALAQESQAFSFDITKLKRGGPDDYPQQPNLFDCGFFTILYMDKFDGKVMENFNENGILYFRMILATDLIDHPMNTEDSAKVFEEETYE